MTDSEFKTWWYTEFKLNDFELIDNYPESFTFKNTATTLKIPQDVINYINTYYEGCINFQPAWINPRPKIKCGHNYRYVDHNIFLDAWTEDQSRFNYIFPPIDLSVTGHYNSNWRLLTGYNAYQLNVSSLTKSGEYYIIPAIELTNSTICEYLARGAQYQGSIGNWSRYTRTTESSSFRACMTVEADLGNNYARQTTLNYTIPFNLLTYELELT